MRFPLISDQIEIFISAGLFVYLIIAFMRWKKSGQLWMLSNSLHVYLVLWLLQLVELLNASPDNDLWHFVFLIVTNCLCLLLLGAVYLFYKRLQRNRPHY